MEPLPEILGKMKTCVVIPTYNESRSIAGIVRGIRQQGLEVIVVDDGSRDSTIRIASDNGATVIRNSGNEGKGASLIKGFKYALQKGFATVITMDGDGQHLPQDIPALLEKAKYSNAGIIIGNRMSKTAGMPRARIWTNRFMSWLISLVAKQTVPDSQCGFRLIQAKLLERLDLVTTKYETESEMLIRAAQMGFAIESAQISTVYGQEKSQINAFIDTIRFIRFILREIWIMPF